VSNKLSMVDLSSNNPNPNLSQHYSAGHRLLLLKASEGTTYSWSQAAFDARSWHHFGGICGHYAFLRPGNGTAQADKFLSTIGPYLGPCDFLVADAEVNGVDGREVHEFLDRVHQHKPQLRTLVYGTAYFLRDKGVTPLHGAGLHIAGYPNVDFIPPGWHRWMAHQFTQSGRATGMPSLVDVSHLHRQMLQPVLRRGMVNYAVRDLKHGLLHAGYGRHTINPTSMHYGAATAMAVRALKKDHGHAFHGKHPGDVAGRAVWEQLDKHLTY
jgi:GH25 family lysozyme M1 (1,4-beta-N-acetylmuramidase)